MWSLRRVAFLLPIMLLLCLAGCSEQADQAPAATRSRKPPATARAPNLLLITLDTTRADALGSYGHPGPTPTPTPTPNIDRLAASGLLFEQVTSASPETLPSHASLFTGQWPPTHGVRSNSGYVLSEQNVTLAEILRDHGYRTSAEVSAEVMRKATLITQGFDQQRDNESPNVVLKQIRFTAGETRTKTEPQRVGADISDKGIDFMRRQRKRPFFLWLHYFDAHHPYSAPAAFNAKFPDSPYHAELASADHQVGRVLDELARLGLREDTLVVLLADHGEGLMEHGEPSHSYLVYDTTMRVPLILAHPGTLPANRRIPSLVRTVDVLPTVLELLELPRPSGIAGVSLAPLIEGDTSDLELAAYGEATRFIATFEAAPLRFLRRGRWKYIHKVNPELYDVLADPAEVDNRIATEPEVAARLRAELQTLLETSAAAPDDAEAGISADTRRQLAALGYVGSSAGGVMRDELASLALHGPDPALLMPDTEALSIAGGLLERDEFEQALELAGGIDGRHPDRPFVLSLMAKSQLGLDRRDEARATLQRLVELRPCDEESHEALRQLDFEDARYAAMLGLLERTVERCPEQLAARNNFAWALATLPDAALRDGERAISEIREAIARQPAPDPAYLDTLAAALAEAGRFAEATQTQREVLQLLRDSGAPAALRDALAQHLASYEAKRPLRDPTPEQRP